MGSTFFSLHYHIVFSTKERRPFIKPEWQPRLHAYLGGIIKGMNGVPEIVGGVDRRPDHDSHPKPKHKGQRISRQQSAGGSIIEP